MATFATKVHAKLDGTNWTDISADVQYADRINIQYGASNQGGRTDAASCSFRLKNTTGNYTPGNPQSAYYPNLGLGTQIRVSVENGEVGLSMQEGVSSTSSTPDAAALDIVGDIDVRVEASLWDWTEAIAGANSGVGNVELIGKFDGAPNKSWWFGVRDGKLYFEWSADGTNTLSATATTELRVPGSHPRMAVRVTLDVDNGAAGNTVTFYRSDSISSGIWEQVGSTVVQGGTTSIANSAASLRIGDATVFTFYPYPLGIFHKAEVRSGIGGSAVANPDFTAQSSGTTSFADAAGRTWTLQGGAEITNRKVRFMGEAASFQPGRIDKSFQYVDVEAGGIMRRLGINDEVFKSAVYRDMTSPQRSHIVAYWPMEDGDAAASFATPTAGADPMTKTPTGVSLASYDLWGASSPLPTFDTGSVWATMPMYTVTGQTSIRWFAAVPAGGVAANQQICSIPTTGTAQQWRLILDTAGGLELRAFDSTGTQVFTTGGIAFLLNGVQAMITLEFTQNGANIDWRIIKTAVSDLTTSVSSGTLAAFTFGRVSGIKLAGGGDFGGGAMGQLSVADDVTGYAASGASLKNWYAEGSGDRIIRLAQEENLPISSAGMSANPQGGQGETDVLTLLRDAADTEQGLFGESRERVGLFYRSPDSLSTQKPVISLTYTDGASAPIVAPFEPVYDDNDLVNDFTATRKDGGFTRAQQTDGRLSVSVPPSGAGRYEGSDTFNVAYEYQTGDLAGWAVNLGTFEGARFSRLRVRLDKKTALVSDLCRLYIGDIVEITGVPLDLAGTNTIKLRVEGYSEIVDQFLWEIVYVMSPGEPWDVGFAGYDTTAWQEEQFAWADTDGSVVAEALTTTETDVDILTDASEPVWTSDPQDSPYDLKTDGEIVRVVAPGSLVNADPLLTTGTTAPWTAQNSVIAIDTAVVMPHPVATASLKMTPNGVSAAANVIDTARAGTVQAGDVYTASGWLFSPTGYSSAYVKVNWHDGGGALLSTSSAKVAAIPANTWTYYAGNVTAPANAVTAAVLAGEDGTPAASAVLYVWALRVNRLKASTVFDNFGRTATDTWANAESGQAWTNTGGAGADYDVLTGFGRHIHPAASVGHHSVTAAPHPSFDIYCDTTAAALSTGASQFTGILARYTDIDNLYEARVEFTTAAAINLTIRKRVAAVETQLGTFSSALTHVAGTMVRVRFQGYGSTLRAKIWAVTAEEPADWKVSVTDSAISAAGSLGVKSVRNAGNTNANAELRFDNLDLITPQTFIVQRSVNGVVKTHSTGADIRLAHPAIAGI